jgi:hypothetical protein
MSRDAVDGEAMGRWSVEHHANHAVVAGTHVARHVSKAFRNVASVARIGASGSAITSPSTRRWSA